MVASANHQRVISWINSAFTRHQSSAGRSITFKFAGSSLPINLADLLDVGSSRGEMIQRLNRN